jgi:hypothetical protein
MAYSAPPARTEISDTYPNPSNAVARVGFGKLWDYVTGLLGSTGSPTAAKAALLVPQDVDFTNRIINGAMVIDQRNAGASVTPANGAYTLDRWKAGLAAASKFSVQQSSTAPDGFSNSLLVTSLSSYAIGSGELFDIHQCIEGFNTADLGWGTASAKTVTLSFWVRSSLTGTFGGSILNGASSYSYPFSYSISSANTWEQKTITIAGPTAGTWVGATNGTGMDIYFGLGVGSTYSGTAGSWSANLYLSATGATSVVGTSGATFYITGVQLEKGSTATSFDYRPYGTELSLCQRYYEIGTDRNALLWSGSLGAVAGNYYTNKGFCVTKRASPTVTTNNETISGFATGAPSLSVDSTGIQISRTSNGVLTTSAYYFYNWQASAEL